MKPSRRLKKPDTSSKLILEEVIGLTTKNANGLASSNSKANCVYLAGCVVVVYNVDSGTQSHLMVSNRTPKPLSCVAISQDGSFVAAGELGHQPAVLIWDAATLAFISELKGHQYGVSCIGFSPDGRRLVSVGFPRDGYICLWDRRSGILFTKVKACSSCSAVASVSFSSDAKFIVTAGKRHLKFWKIGSSTRPRTNTGAGALTMQGKSVILSHHKGCLFTAVTSSIWTDSCQVDWDQAGEVLPIYALTDAGVLCVLHSGLSIRNWVDLKVEKGFALSASNKLIACACNNGVVKLYSVKSLKFAGSLQYTETKNCNKTNDLDCHTKLRANAPTFPDAIACQFSTLEKLVVVYGDHSLYIWDIRDLYKASRCCVLVSHSACIWDITNLLCENMHAPSLACVARGCSGGVSFATCSADGTVRLWNLASQPLSSEDGPALATDHNFLITEPVRTSCLVSAGIFERNSVETGVSTEGFRSMAVSSDGKHLAAGDCRGNLHIYNLHSSDYICFQDVHDAEILSLSFSDIFSEVSESHYFLASGGRDRMIHLYDVKRNFDLIGSIDDHSSAVYSVKLACNGCKILSCSADRSLVSRDVEITDTDFKVSRCHQMASQGTVYDMAVDPLMEVAVTVGQDKKINAFSITSGKLIRSLKPDGDFGDPIKVTMDPSCSYVVCSYSNRSICMYDFITGEMVARAVGHAEVINGVIFLPDCKHIVSVGGDGCIFVWKVPAPLSVRMLQRIKESLGPLSPITMAMPPVALSQIMFHTKDDHLCKTNPKEVSVLKNSNQASQKLLCQRGGPQATSAFKFSISRLPKWAQAKVTSSGIIPTNPEFTMSQQVGPEAFSPSVSYGGGYSPVCPEVQTPSKHELEGSEPVHGGMHIISSDTDNSQGSPMPRRSCSFAMDKRWLTIHTVCLDLLNSPEIWDMKDIKVPVSIPNLSEDPAVETSNINCIGASSRKFGVNNSSVEPTSGLGNNVVGVYNASACHEVLVREVTEHLQLDTTESRVQATVDVDASHMKSQYNDLFNLNSGNLSAKLKREGRKSSTGRSYSAQFVVRRDLLRGQNKLFDTPVQDFGVETMNWSEEAAPGTTLGDPSIQVLEESQRKDDCKQDPKNSTQNLLCPSRILSQSDSTENSVKKEVIRFRDQEESNSEGIEKQQTVIACKEALLNLDAAAENALQLFSKLGGMASIEEISRGPGAQLYDEVTQMLPSIANKVHAVAKLLQHTNNSSGTTRVNVSSLEPLLGTFAETLSQRVVELLKKNCSSP